MTLSSLLSKKISLQYLLGVILGCSISTFIVTKYFYNNSSDLNSNAEINSSSKFEAKTSDNQNSSNTGSNAEVISGPSTTIVQSSCSFHQRRLNDFTFIKPLLFVDNACESDGLMPIKQSINSLIENYKSSGNLISASVYLREISTGDWMSINENEKYNPGSLLKVPELIAFLKMEEQNPGYLNTEILYERPFNNDKIARYQSKSIQIGQKYTIKELLTYMIEYSDNNATLLLNTIINVPMFKKVFTDLGLPSLDWNAKNYPLSSREYSLFMRILYNASYLTDRNSQFAIDLLTKSDFKDGLLKALPSTIPIAHKFGEAGNASEAELHESAIVYLNNAPYLLTVMTKGKNYVKLPEVLSQISNEIYSKIRLLSFKD